MAAIDKIYLTYEEYIQFREWLLQQPKLKDKYGTEVSLMNYVLDYWNKDNWGNKERPAYCAPYYVDAYIIRNCPLKFVQEELELNYGYWSQERIKSFYDDVKNWDNSKGECPYWAKLDDFIFLEDGTMSIKSLNVEDDYTSIKNGNLYASPKRENYEYGKHFRCIKHPKYLYNTPYGCKRWFISVDIPDNGYMVYHSNHNSWDFTDEFVFSDWNSSTAYVKTIKALKRLMLKWKLPVGTVVTASGRYISDEYKFIIT